MELNRKIIDSEIILTDMLKYCLLDVGFNQINYNTKIVGAFTRQLKWINILSFGRSLTWPMLFFGQPKTFLNGFQSASFWKQYHYRLYNTAIYC